MSLIKNSQNSREADNLMKIQRALIKFFLNILGNNSISSYSNMIRRPVNLLLDNYAGNFSLLDHRSHGSPDINFAGKNNHLKFTDNDKSLSSIKEDEVEREIDLKMEKTGSKKLNAREQYGMNKADEKSNKVHDQNELKGRFNQIQDIKIPQPQKKKFQTINENVQGKIVMGESAYPEPSKSADIRQYSTHHNLTMDKQMTSFQRFASPSNNNPKQQAERQAMFKRYIQISFRILSPGSYYLPVGEIIVFQVYWKNRESLKLSSVEGKQTVKKLNDDIFEIRAKLVEGLVNIETESGTKIGEFFAVNNEKLPWQLKALINFEMDE